MLHDFTSEEEDDEVVAYTVRQKKTIEERKNLSSTERILVQINTLRDSMDEDEDFVLPTNFPVVSSILLEFLHRLGEGMVCLLLALSISFVWFHSFQSFSHNSFYWVGIRL